MAICNKTRSPHKSFWEYAKKLLSVSLCLAVLSLGLPPRQSARVEAAEEKLSLPDTAFITKDKLLKLCEETNVVDGKPTGLLATGKLKEDGGTDVKLRINFGRRPEAAHYYKESRAQATAAAGPTTWLVAGGEKFTPEGGSEADGLVLYSEEPLMSDQQFNTSYGFSAYTAPADTGYGASELFMLPYANHWGGSDLRWVLNAIYVGNKFPYKGFFNNTEKGLMSPSTIRTYDVEQTPAVEYITTDVLYAPRCNLNQMFDDEGRLLKGSRKITVGDVDSLTVDQAYWRGYQWLRSPYPPISHYASAALPGFGVCSDYVCHTDPSISAAFRLNLSSVLFASAASAASSSEGGKFEKISADTPMTLRIKSPESSKAAVGSIDGNIVTKNAAGWTLMVQGVTSDGQNWSYSKAIGTNDDVTVTSAEVAGAGSIELENFDDCEVWLEKPVEDGGLLAYATQPVTAKPPIETTVKVSNVQTQRIRLYDPYAVLPSDVEFSAKYRKLSPNFIIQVGPVSHTYDLTLTSGGKELSQELAAPVTLRFEAVNGIDAADAAVTRIVNGASKDLKVSDVTDENNTAWVEVTTDHFSRYVLVTGRRAARILLAGIATLLILALGFTIRFLRKKKKN